MTATLTFPPGRYGRRRDPVRQRQRRWMTWVLATFVVIAGVAIAAKLYDQYTLAPYQVRIVGVTDVTDTHVTVTFEVTTPPGEAAACTVRARARSGEEVGRARVIVPPGGPDQTKTTFTYTLATTSRPVTGEVPGCGPPD